MRERLSRIMYGRYGVDQLTRFMIGVAVVLIILNLFINFRFITFLALVLLILCYIRIFSRNTAKRSEENATFMRITGKYRGWFTKQRNLSKQKKDYRIYNCPSCKQKVRVPKGKGKIIVTCPKCRTQFQKRS